MPHAVGLEHDAAWLPVAETAAPATKRCTAAAIDREEYAVVSFLRLSGSTCLTVLGLAGGARVVNVLVSAAKRRARAFHHGLHRPRKHSNVRGEKPPPTDETCR